MTDFDTDPTLARLAEQRAEHLAAGRLPEVQRVDQEVIAVQTLARLADDRQAAADAGNQDTVAAIDAQAQYWLRQVDLPHLLADAATELRAGGDVSAAGTATVGDGGSESVDGPAGQAVRKPKAS